jgi:hypothetical protein
MLRIDFGKSKGDFTVDSKSILIRILYPANPSKGKTSNIFQWKDDLSKYASSNLAPKLFLVVLKRRRPSLA